MGHHAPHI